MLLYLDTLLLDLYFVVNMYVYFIFVISFTQARFLNANIYTHKLQKKHKQYPQINKIFCVQSGQFWNWPFFHTGTAGGSWLSPSITLALCLWWFALLPLCDNYCVRSNPKWFKFCFEWSNLERKSIKYLYIF